MMLAIGVIGGHGAIFHHQNWAVLAGLGRAIAERAGTLVTGTCSGLPYAVVLGARAAGGLVVGISPASTRHDHLFRHGCPTEGYTMLLLTGAVGRGSRRRSPV
jgi:predicted Rossmann-fold nucleotide-binding protein